MLGDLCYIVQNLNISNMPLFNLLNIPLTYHYNVFPEPVKSGCSQPEEDIEVTFLKAMTALP